MQYVKLKPGNFLAIHGTQGMLEIQAKNLDEAYKVAQKFLKEKCGVIEDIHIVKIPDNIPAYMKL